jgi:hypothetical protein
MVEEISCDPALDHIEAEVSGSSGNIYDVEITAAARGVDATCSCPFEGYPCKHIVAVLLTFLKKKDELLKRSTGEKKVYLKESKCALSKDRLVWILMNFRSPKSSSNLRHLPPAEDQPPGIPLRRPATNQRPPDVKDRRTPPGSMESTPSASK